MSDCQPAILPYSEAVQRGVPEYARQKETGDDTYGKILAQTMYDRSIKSIEGGTAMYQQVTSKHNTLVDGASRGMLHACFCPRNSRLPPIESWMAAISSFQPDDTDERYYVIDKAALLLPTTFGNYNQQVSLAVLMFAYLKQEFNGAKILYPTIRLEKKETHAPVNYAVSKTAVLEVSTGTVELQVNRHTSQAFYRL